MYVRQVTCIVHENVDAVGVEPVHLFTEFLNGNYVSQIDGHEGGSSGQPSIKRHIQA